MILRVSIFSSTSFLSLPLSLLFLTLWCWNTKRFGMLHVKYLGYIIIIFKNKWNPSQSFLKSHNDIYHLHLCCFSYMWQLWMQKWRDKIIRKKMLQKNSDWQGTIDKYFQWWSKWWRCNIATKHWQMIWWLVNYCSINM